MDQVMTKKCGRCQKYVRMADYSMDSRALDGRSAYCKACKRDYRIENDSKKRKFEEAFENERIQYVSQLSKLAELNVILAREIDLKNQRIEQLEYIIYYHNTNQSIETEGDILNKSL